MGASTTQNIFSMKPEKFATSISIACITDFSNIQKLKSKKIWLIHGKQNIENLYIGSEKLYRKLAGNKHTYLCYSNTRSTQPNAIQPN
jgi:predicted peptidase